MEGISKESLGNKIKQLRRENLTARNAIELALITELLLECKELDSPNNSVKNYSEWYNSLSGIITNHYSHCSRQELAEAAFRAGYEAGKNNKED